MLFDRIVGEVIVNSPHKGGEAPRAGGRAGPPARAGEAQEGQAAGERAKTQQTTHKHNTRKHVLHVANEQQCITAAKQVHTYKEHTITHEDHNTYRNKLQASELNPHSQITTHTHN